MKTEPKKVYLSAPHMSGKERAYIDQAFAENWIAPLGPHVNAFESELAEYLGVKEVAVLTSGTAAIHLSLQLCGIKSGDLVFCSSLTFAASANPILHLGAEPVFIDAEPETWNMSPEALERALKEAEYYGHLPKAVIAVNLYGQSADLDQLTALSDRYGIPMIEDAAESLGATYYGKPSGSFGLFGILSFNGNKIITTAGGGALVSNNAELIKQARYLATQARQPARHYEHTEAGYNYRMSNVLAAIGRGQLEVLEERVNARRAVFDRYYSELNSIKGFDFMPEADFGRSNRWLTVLTVDPGKCGVSRDEIIDALEAENIEARPVWKPMHLQPLYRSCRYYPHFTDDASGKDISPSPRPSPLKGEGEDVGSLSQTFTLKGERNYKGSVSDQLFELGLCLPSGSNLKLEEQARVIRCIRSLL